jgi:hypothetical protein
MIPMITASEVPEMWRANFYASVMAEVFGGPLDERGRDLVRSIEEMLCCD